MLHTKLTHKLHPVWFGILDGQIKQYKRNKINSKTLFSKNIIEIQRMKYIEKYINYQKGLKTSQRSTSQRQKLM